MMTNIPELKLGLVSVSRDCFPMALSVGRRDALAAAYAKYGVLHNCPVCIESETDVAPALADLKAAGVNALVIFLGNFGPETAETTLAKQFDGPVMFCAAAEESGDSLLDGRGDAYCGVLNCSYNLGMRHLKAYLPEYPVGTAQECADMIREFVPIARAIIGVKNLKIITFGGELRAGPAGGLQGPCRGQAHPRGGGRHAEGDGRAHLSRSAGADGSV